MEMIEGFQLGLCEVFIRPAFLGAIFSLSAPTVEKIIRKFDCWEWRTTGRERPIKEIDLKSFISALTQDETLKQGMKGKIEEGMKRIAAAKYDFKKLEKKCWEEQIDALKVKYLGE